MKKAMKKLEEFVEFSNIVFFYYDRGIRIWMVSGNCGLEYG